MSRESQTVVRRRRVTARLIIAVAACCAARPAPDAHAAVTSSGNVIPIPPAAGGAFAGPFEIGDVDVGTISISGGTAISHTGAAVLGDTVTGIGIASLSGLGSDWTLTSAGGDFTVANNGTGSLTLSNLAFLGVNDDLFVAAQLNSMGRITISGLGTILGVGDDANIGQRSQAIVEISNGGRLLTDQNIIGDEATGDGRVTLSDELSIWRAVGTITVADAGRANLQILNGARVENTAGVVASQAGSHGAVEVVGTGSLWQNSTSLIVGEFGHASLTVADGGRVTNGAANSLLIGRQIGSVGTVEVRGAGSLLSAYLMDVGDSGTGTLRVLDGGRVSSGISVIGDNGTARGEVFVSGTGSRWDLSGGLDVGDFGQAQLTIAAGGVVHTSVSARVAARGQLTLDAGRIEIDSDAVGLSNVGVIDGNGVVDVLTANNASNGRISPRGDNPVLFTGTLNNFGLIDVASGVLEVAAATNNSLDIDARNGSVLRFAAPAWITTPGHNSPSPPATWMYSARSTTTPAPRSPSAPPPSRSSTTPSPTTARSSSSPVARC